jgi:hypothetical protein
VTAEEHRERIEAAWHAFLALGGDDRMNITAELFGATAHLALCALDCANALIARERSS